MSALVRLARSIDQRQPCCGNLARVVERQGMHAAALNCARCSRFRGWLPKRALIFIRQATVRRSGPTTLRDWTITDGVQTMDIKQRDNSGVLFKVLQKRNADGPDYTGSATVAGTPCEIAGWIKIAKNGNRFLSLNIKPKDAAKQPAMAGNDFHDDPIGF